jgi:hypothetical protein
MASDDEFVIKAEKLRVVVELEAAEGQDYIIIRRTLTCDCPSVGAITVCNPGTMACHVQRGGKLEPIDRIDSLRARPPRAVLDTLRARLPSGLRPGAPRVRRPGDDD